MRINIIIIVIILLICFFLIIKFRNKNNKTETFYSATTPSILDVNSDCYSKDQDQCNSNSNCRYLENENDQLRECVAEQRCDEIDIDDCPDTSDDESNCLKINGLKSVCSDLDEDNCQYNSQCILNYDNKCIDKDAYNDDNKCFNHDNSENNCNNNAKCKYYQDSYCNPKFLDEYITGNIINSAYQDEAGNYSCSSANDLIVERNSEKKCINYDNLCITSYNNLINSDQETYCSNIKLDKSSYSNLQYIDNHLDLNLGTDKNNMYLPRSFIEVIDANQNIDRFKKLNCKDIQNIKNYFEENPESEGIDNFNNYLESDIHDDKCITHTNCSDKCTNLEFNECIDTEGCSINLHNDECQRVQDLNCKNKDIDNCENGDDNCRIDKKYNYQLCIPNLTCQAGKRLKVNVNNNISCGNCPAGTYSENGICKNCGYGEYSREGSSNCNEKTTCLKDDDKFVNITIPVETNDLLDSFNLDSKTKKQLKFNLKKDLYNLNNTSNNNCQDLSKCDDNEMVTNFHDYTSEIMLENNFNNFFDNYHNDNSDTKPVLSEDPIRFNNYQCEVLHNCNENQFISNWEEHKQKIDDMYHIDRVCTDLTNCEKGTYITEMVSEDYPVINQIDGKEILTHDRECISCSEYEYTDRTNQVKCQTQPVCNKGELYPGDPENKDRLVNCSDCQEHTYQDQSNHRVKSCKSQPLCAPGYKYPGDPKNRDFKVTSCIQCKPDTYQDQFNHREESCIPQPTLGLGEGALGYDPTLLGGIQQIQKEDCDGHTTYQDEVSHRNPCKTHIVCDKGELINDPTPTASRICNEIELDSSNYYQGHGYMDKENHREIIALTQPTCEENKVLFFENDSDIRFKVKNEGECKSRDEAADLAFEECN